MRGNPAEPNRRRSLPAWCFSPAAAIPFAALLLAWPALLNRYPLLYPDSVGYLQDGRATAAAIFLHRLAGYNAQRSELYSLGIFPFHWNVSPWPIVALNALLTAYVLYLTIRSILPRHTLPRFLAITLFLSVFTSASWFVSLLMPDILGALLYLAIYLLVFAGETLSRAERFALSGIVLWAVTAHSTHLMLALGLCLLLTLLLLLGRRETTRVRHACAAPAERGALRGHGFSAIGLAHIAILVALAAAAQTALHAYLYGHASLDGSRPPYLMARIIADGPGAQYLRQHCATPQSPGAAQPIPDQLSPDWAICAHVQHLPDNDDDFLWGTTGIWSTSDHATQQRLLAEEMPLVRATLRAYPREQIAVSWANFTHQINDFGVNDFDNNAWMEASLESPLPGSHAMYRRSLQAHDSVPTNAFTILQRWVVLPSAVLLAMLLPWLIRHRRENPTHARLLGLTAVVLPTLFCNALITAVLSSSDSRYQARIVWLLPLLAILTLLSALRPLGMARQSAGRTC
jgi:hypothetical protein